MCDNEIQYIQGRYDAVWYTSFNQQAFSKKPAETFRKIDTNTICDHILSDVCSDPPKISLKSAGRLVHGVTSMYGRQVNDLYEKSYGVMQAQASYNAIVRQAELSESCIKGKQRGIKRKATDESVDEDFQYLMDFEENLCTNIDIEMESFAVNMATRDQVTLRENVSPRVSQFDILDDTMDDFEPLAEDSELFDLPDDAFDPDGPLRASTPIQFDEISDHHSNDSHQEESTSEPSNSEQTNNTESMEVTPEPSIVSESTHNDETSHESVPMEVTEVVAEGPTDMEIDKENQPHNAQFLEPSMTAKEFSKSITSIKKKSRKNKWFQRDTVTQINVYPENLDNNDILKSYPENVDLKLAVRQANKMALKRLKLIRPANELLSSTARQFPSVPARKTKKRSRNESAPELPPAKRIKETENLFVLAPGKRTREMEIVDLESELPTAKRTKEHQVVEKKNTPPIELAEMFENLATIDVPIRRVRSVEIPRQIVESPLKRAKTGLGLCADDDWQSARLEWSQIAMLEILLPEMIKSAEEMRSAVPFESVKRQLKSKKAATIAFTSLINLSAKGFIQIQNSENSIGIMEIKKGAKLRDPIVSLECTIQSLSDADFM